MPRPPFIVSTADVAERTDRYPKSDELLCHGRAIGKHTGLLRIGLHVVRLEPGHRTSYPHAESSEEEFVYVLDGEVDAWIDGELHPMKAGDLAAFPAGTGICHSFLNNGDMAWSEWWDDVPARPLGPHDGRPRRREL
jgi:uncharacterized cupin superfamily protein